MKPLRKLVLVDTGELVDPSYVRKGSVIHMPDICKRIDNFGYIVAVSDRCELVSHKDIGKKCLLKVDHHDDYRIRPRTSKKIGLKPTWHFIVPESHIDAIIEE